MNFAFPALRMFGAAALLATFGLVTPLTAGDDLDQAAQKSEATKAAMEEQKEATSDKADDSDAENMAESMKSDAMEKLNGLD